MKNLASFMLIFLIFYRKWLYIWLIHILIVILHSETHEIIMKTIFKKYDKHAISALPRVTFEGIIKVIDKLEEVDAAVDFLLAQDILGVDTETRPSFKKGVSYEVCLLQVSTLEVCFLFRLNKIGMPPAILRLLTDKKVPKIGLSWHDDLHQLHRKSEFQPGLFVDIQDMAKDFGVEDLSLQKLYANLFHQKISKSQRLSNWEMAELRDSQKVYAATDAWACIMLYNEFNRLKESQDYILVEPVVPEPVESALPAEPALPVEAVETTEASEASVNDDAETVQNEQAVAEA